MSLSNELVSEFIKVTNDTAQEKQDVFVYGTVKTIDEKIYVQLDGSDLLTPIVTTTEVKNEERVTVLIKDHTAMITGNSTAPSASLNTVADKVDVAELNAVKANVEDLEATKLSVNEANVKYATIENLNVEKGRIDTLETSKLSADVADIKYATIANLNVEKGRIDDLETSKLSAEEADIKYASIDFANIGEAAIKKLFTDSGIIKDLVVSEGHITGELVGVTIKGDLIEGNTIVADKLVVKGEDGIYYKLNTDGVTTEAEQTDYNSLNGTVIRAKSVTAEKIAVDDLVAFDATIGGFNITDSALYSGVKSSIDNTTRGIYLDKYGQIVFGDNNNYLKYYRSSDGTYKLEIVAGTIKMGTSNKTIEETVTEMQAETENLKETLANEVNTLKDEISTLLRIESSRGTVFKNNAVSTVLSAVIYRGSRRITDINTLKEVMGSGAYLQWKWQRLTEDTFGIISADDSRIKDGGFTFILNPDDVDTKVTFICELIVD